MRDPSLFSVRRFVLISAIVAPMLVACAPSTEEQRAPLPPPNEPASIAASDETRRTIGVETWGISNDPERYETTVRGYDAQNRRVAELRHKAIVIDDEHVTVEIRLSGERGSAFMQIDFEGREGETEDTSELSMTITENTFPDADGTEDVLARMTADTGAGGEVTSGMLSGGGGSLVKSSLHPLEGQRLVENNCQELIASCGMELVRSGGSAAANSNACSRLVRATGITMVCKAAGRLIGRAVGLLAGGYVGGPAGAAVGGAAGGVAGGYIGKHGCSYATGRNEAQRECVAATTSALGQTAGGEQCQSARTACTGS